MSGVLKSGHRKVNLYRHWGECTGAGVHVLLHRTGWSVRVPARRAAERDETSL